MCWQSAAAAVQVTTAAAADRVAVLYFRQVLPSPEQSTFRLAQEAPRAQATQIMARSDHLHLSARFLLLVEIAVFQKAPPVVLRSLAQAQVETEAPASLFLAFAAETARHTRSPEHQ